MWQQDHRCLTLAEYITLTTAYLCRIRSAEYSTASLQPLPIRLRLQAMHSLSPTLQRSSPARIARSRTIPMQGVKVSLGLQPDQYAWLVTVLSVAAQRRAGAQF